MKGGLTDSAQPVTLLALVGLSMQCNFKPDSFFSLQVLSWTMKVAALVVIVLSFIVLSEARSPSAEEIVVTPYGNVAGQVFSTHRAFKVTCSAAPPPPRSPDFHCLMQGIPYIAPPVGKLRFTPPVPVQPWKPSTLNATAFKPGCPQNCHLPPRASVQICKRFAWILTFLLSGTCPDVQSEDCVYVNIFTPRLSALTTKQPVMVFLPGTTNQSRLFKTIFDVWSIK